MPSTMLHDIYMLRNDLKDKYMYAQSNWWARGGVEPLATQV